MKALERKITREQALLLFNIPDNGINEYRLKLIPIYNDDDVQSDKKITMANWIKANIPRTKLNYDANKHALVVPANAPEDIKEWAKNGKVFCL